MTDHNTKHRGETAVVDIPRTCRALNICGYLLGGWLAVLIATIFLLTALWQFAIWCLVGLGGFVGIVFVGDTLSDLLGEVSGSTPGVDS